MVPGTCCRASKSLVLRPDFSSWKGPLVRVSIDDLLLVLALGENHALFGMGTALDDVLVISPGGVGWIPSGLLREVA